jgi:hypothetical protein
LLRNLADELRLKLTISKLPLRSPIFLPTSAFPKKDALAGLKRVKAIYDHRLHTTYAERLRSIRSRHAGSDRCFVVGNGPSLNKMNLENLKGEVTFCVNSFFLKSAQLSWMPTFYVVEDHLVAEDRREELASLQGTTKLFPANLAYCLPEADDTIFFNHRPRKSFPDGFDFSLQADQITYTGCTVTFTCLQLAAYFGFKAIYLIGVDADYAMPKDAQVSTDYGVSVIDMDSDDPNHFDSDYFGKGYRWHDPQVEKMLGAYSEARDVSQECDFDIYNAGIGGKLEVFERVDFEALF